MVTALGQEENIVKELETGADDYVNKPFKMPILLARISGLINSTSTSPETSISTPEGMDRLIFCGLLIDPPASF